MAIAGKTAETPSLVSTGIDELGFQLPWCFEEHHIEWQQAVRNFCESEVQPGAMERSIEARFDDGLARRLGELGLYGALIPEEHGGTGAGLISFCLAIEELARVDSSLAVTAHVQGISVALFHHLATPEQRKALLPDMLRGETYIAFGLTEPTSGSDAGNMGTKAVRDGDDWIINGSKQFITNSGTPMSKYIVLFAATGGQNESKRPAVSAFLVPLDAPGVTVAKGYPKMGWRASDTHPLFFDDVRVSSAQLLAEEGKGYKEALRFLTWARIPIAAMSAGLAQGCLEASLEFVGDRRSFDQPLGAHQGPAFAVSEIAAMAATARAMTYDAAWKHDHGYPYDRTAAIAKLMASELANRAAYQATQLHGGYGFIDESAVTRHYRDARILTIGEGTSEIQKLLIARSFGLPQ